MAKPAAAVEREPRRERHSERDDDDAGADEDARAYGRYAREP